MLSLQVKCVVSDNDVPAPVAPVTALICTSFCKTFALAKGKNRNAGDETIYHENKEYKFEKNDPLLFFIQRLRDEAHRFAISTHRAKRKKNLSKSLLDQIEGIGKQRKKSLLNHFGSARAVESASFEELKSVEGIEDNIAKKIYDYFHE